VKVYLKIWTEKISNRYLEKNQAPYDRVHLSEYFAGKSADDLSMSTSNWYTENNIILNTSELITDINKEDKKYIRTRNNTC
jgi:NAD(P)H-nitrite reductase large subunit